MNKMINNIGKGLIASLLLSVSLTSCLDEPLTVTTFEQEMMGEYMEKRPEQFSEFIKLLDTTEVLGLLNAYGPCLLLITTRCMNFINQREKVR